MVRTDKLTAILLAAVIGFCLVMQCANGDAGDKGWILNFSRMLLGGKALYSGIFSAVPPLIFWLYAIPSAFAIILHLSGGFILALLCMVMVAGSVALSASLIGTVSFFAQSRRTRIEFALLQVFMFTVWSHVIYFGDREHIFLVLVFPYLLRCMPSLSSQKLPLHVSIATGCMAALGFCIKPHCAQVFMAVQLLFFCQSRSPRILASMENLIIYAVALAYLALVEAFAPDYYEIVLPMTLTTYPAMIDKDGLIFYGAVAAAFFAIAFADFRLRDHSPLRRDIFYFLGICAAFLLYALTNNGWGYTWNPLGETILFVTGLIRWEYQFLAAEPYKSDSDKRRYRFGTRACMFNFMANTLIVFGLYGMSFFVPCDASCKIDKDMKRLVQQRNVHSFGFISINFEHPATLSRDTAASMETRFNHIWMLPAFFISDASFTAQHKTMLDYVTHAYADDMNNNKPALMFVDDTDMFYRIYHPVDLVAYLSADGAFRDAWSHYRFLTSINYCAASAHAKKECKYEVYMRINDDETSSVKTYERLQPRGKQ